MNLALLLPSALLALSALLIPLLIHLSRRSEQKPTDFAALRWISAQLRPRRKLVFQEIPLLLLRLLLLIALALFLAKPVSMQTTSREHWVVVVPGADITTAKNVSFDKSAKWHWLSPGFPDFEKKPVASNSPISSMLRELDAQLPASAALTIIVPEQLSGLDGERIRLSRKVDWKIVSGKQKEVGVIPAPDYSIRWQAVAGTQRRESTENSNAVALGPRLRGDDGLISSDDIAPIHLAIRHDEKHADSAIYFRAVHASWQTELKTENKTALDSADISSPIKPDANTLAWLASGELPAGIHEWANKGGTLIVSKDSVVPEIKSGVTAWRDDQGKALVLAAPLGQGRVLQWQQDLKPAAMPELLDADFPEHLKSLLHTRPLAPMHAFANTQRPLTGANAGPETPQSLQIWFALLVALLSLLERGFANSSRRWSAA